MSAKSGLGGGGGGGGLIFLTMTTTPVASNQFRGWRPWNNNNNKKKCGQPSVAFFPPFFLSTWEDEQRDTRSQSFNCEAERDERCSCTHIYELAQNVSTKKADNKNYCIVYVYVLMLSGQMEVNFYLRHPVCNCASAHGERGSPVHVWRRRTKKNMFKQSTHQVVKCAKWVVV